jgi:hypothetical protein
MHLPGLFRPSAFGAIFLLITSTVRVFFDCEKGLDGLVLGNILSHTFALLVFQLDISFFPTDKRSSHLSVNHGNINNKGPVYTDAGTAITQPREFVQPRRYSSEHRRPRVSFCIPWSDSPELSELLCRLASLCEGQHETSILVIRL